MSILILAICSLVGCGGAAAVKEAPAPKPEEHKAAPVAPEALPKLGAECKALAPDKFAVPDKEIGFVKLQACMRDYREGKQLQTCMYKGSTQGEDVCLILLDTPGEPRWRSMFIDCVSGEVTEVVPEPSDSEFEGTL